jgi:hypothetical protein
VLPDIPGVDSTLRAHGMVFASFTASMFIVGHSDYVRSVRIVPCGPERIELVIDWMVSADAPSLGEGQLAHLLELGRLVIEQTAGPASSTRWAALAASPRGRTGAAGARRVGVSRVAARAARGCQRRTT